MKTRTAITVLSILFGLSLILNFTLYDNKHHSCNAPCRVHFSDNTEEDDVFWDWEGHYKDTAYIYKGRH